jgi:(2Fe-2S) ferredoxin
VIGAGGRDGQEDGQGGVQDGGGQQRADAAPARFTVRVCIGPTCGDSRGGHALLASLAERLRLRGLDDRVALVEEACLGHCLRGPNILVGPQDSTGMPPSGASPAAATALYSRVTPADLERIVDRHLSGGIVIRALLNRPPIRNP